MFPVRLLDQSQIEKENTKYPEGMYHLLPVALWVQERQGKTLTSLLCRVTAFFIGKV